jgi:hypothetical protein
MVNDVRERDQFAGQEEDGMDVIGHDHEGIEQDTGRTMWELFTALIN